MKKQDIAALIDGKIKGQGSAIDIGGALPEILGGLNENSVSEDMDETAQMQMRKDLGLYYEETTEDEKTAQYTDQPAVPDYGTVKLSDDVPEPEDIVDVLYEGEHVDFTVSDKAFGGFSVFIPNQQQQVMSFEVRETPLNPVYPSAGIWVTPSGLDEPKKYTLVYKASETVISKVPEKFLPEMGDEVEGNPEVPQGTSPTALENLRINNDYFSIPQGGGGSVGPIVVTSLSDGTISQSAADALGLTIDEVRAAAQGQRTGVLVGDSYIGNYLHGILYAFCESGSTVNQWSLILSEGTKYVSGDDYACYIIITGSYGEVTISRRRNQITAAS